MDYKYIEQLLERYWRCETSLEEEQILHAFFSQEDIPAELMRYKPLFGYAAEQKAEEVLGADFDAKVMAVIESQTPVKAKIISMTDRLKPLFKAAAVVAIILTLGNAMQIPFNDSDADAIAAYDGYTMPSIRQTNPVAMRDSLPADTMKHSMVNHKAALDETTIK